MSAAASDPLAGAVVGADSVAADAVLGLDTATRVTAVAVLAPGSRRAATYRRPAPGARPGHAVELLELVEAVLSEAGVDWSQMARIGVGLGPGSFTGLRIGVAAARALAQTRGLSIVGVGTLEVLASAALDAGPGPVLVLTDAGRREFFAAAFTGSAADAARPHALVDPVALSADGVLAALRQLPGALRAVGEGSVQLRGSLEAAGVAVPADESGLHRVDAEQLCRLAAAAPPVDRDTLTPRYGRAPDARPRATG